MGIRFISLKLIKYVLNSHQLRSLMNISRQINAIMNCLEKNVSGSQVWNEPSPPTAKTGRYRYYVMEIPEMPNVSHHEDPGL